MAQGTLVCESSRTPLVWLTQLACEMDLSKVVESLGLPVNLQKLEFISNLGLMEQVCMPTYALGMATLIIAVLLFVLWMMHTRMTTLHMQLEQSSDDAASLSELFSSELERLRSQLLKSTDDSRSLDEILNSILRGGLPGHLEMASIDYWCVKTMDVQYIDQEGERRTWRQSGYHINCFVPGGARDVEVTFSVVGGTRCMRVDRSKHDLPWVYDEMGRKTPEKFMYKRCPGNVRFEISGPSLGAFISHVTEVHEPNLKEGSPARKDTAEATPRRSRLCT